MSNYLTELITFGNIITEEANGFVDHNVFVTVGNHTIYLEMSAELFDDIDNLIKSEINRVLETEKSPTEVEL